MSPCRTGSDTYLNHACYTYLKVKFKDIKVGEYSLDAFKKIYDIFQKENNRHSYYYPLFRELVSHTTNGSVFYSADPRIPCNFINYLLNDNLRNKKYLYDDISHYDIYQKFLKDFYIERHGRYHQNQVCDVHIDAIKEEIFQRMTSLYRLYDDYDDLNEQKENVDSTACDKLGKFASLFNYNARTHGKYDNEIHEKLKGLKCLIEKKISSIYDTCNTNINYFHLQEPSSTVQEKQNQDLSHGKRHQEPETKSPEILSTTQETDALLTYMPQVLNEPEVPEGLPPSRGSERLNTLMESHHPVGSVHLKPLGYEWETENYESRGSHVSGTSHESASYKPEFFHRLGGSNMQRPQESHLLMEKEKGNTEAGIYSPGFQISNAAAKEEGASGILSFITGVLGDVEPGPVLGVSGGMGALFLLFKYTPVGTFFRGGRVRARRIPSGFSGQFLGTFPDMQDYGGGYVGYSPMDIPHLAE
ncbi:unnamed protein product [Plasmodium vivax]|uniref:(malaria parasite P. vivax) hypothetical protein n=1 Tax=Plasmodium vivax TaxID=5855 RepID=A0A8S4HF02_PLAVI|nr:unnamed protein product [Plasmodium vivax]